MVGASVQCSSSKRSELSSKSWVLAFWMCVLIMSIQIKRWAETFFTIVTFVWFPRELLFCGVIMISFLWIFCHNCHKQFFWYFHEIFLRCAHSNEFFGNKFFSHFSQLCGFLLSWTPLVWICECLACKKNKIFISDS